MEVSMVIVSEHVIQWVVPTPTLPPSFHTNAYIIHDGNQALIVDLGSADDHIREQLVDFLRTENITHVVGVLATHGHPDHVDGMPAIANYFQCPVWIHPLDVPLLSEDVRSAVNWLPAGKQVKVGNISVEIIHAPGHTHGHLYVAVWRDAVVLVGDHLAGDGSVWVGPPHGHMQAYYDSLRWLMEQEPCQALPGHGSGFSDARQAASDVLHRREQREVEILDMLRHKSRSIDELLSEMYTSTVPKEALWAARRTIQGHLCRLIDVDAVERFYDTTEKQFCYRPKEAS